MSSDSTFTIEARIDHRSDGVGCFDPVQVVCRLRDAFPELIESSHDCLWEACDQVRKLEGAEAAVRTAVRDMQERGPKIQFEIPILGGRSVKGTAERYWVLVTARETFPDDFRRRFVAFLESLTLQSIQIRCGDNT
jgi:hypothetical protein